MHVRMHENIMMNEYRYLGNVFENRTSELCEVVGVLEHSDLVVAAPDDMQHCLRWDCAWDPRHVQNIKQLSCLEIML